MGQKLSCMCQAPPEEGGEYRDENNKTTSRPNHCQADNNSENNSTPTSSPIKSKDDNSPVSIRNQNNYVFFNIDDEGVDPFIIDPRNDNYSPDEDEKITIKSKNDYYDTMGGKLPPIEAIKENVCEESSIHLFHKDEKRIPHSKSAANFSKDENADHPMLYKMRIDEYKRSHLNFHKLFKHKVKKDRLILWKSLNLLDIIPKAKLLSKDYETIIFKGELYRYATPNSNNCNQLCYRKFFVLDKKFLCSYKSKESFLKMHEPLLRINLKEILVVDRIAYEHKINLKVNCETIYNFYIQMNSNEMTNIQTTKFEERKNEAEERINEYGNNMTSDNNEKLQDRDLVMTKYNNETENQERDFCSYMFGFESEEIVNKWVFLIDYFVKN